MKPSTYWVNGEEVNGCCIPSSCKESKATPSFPNPGPPPWGGESPGSKILMIWAGVSRHSTGLPPQHMLSAIRGGPIRSFQTNKTQLTPLVGLVCLKPAYSAPHSITGELMGSCMVMFNDRGPSDVLAYRTGRWRGSFPPLSVIST